MHKFILIYHLRSRHYELLDEWIHKAGVYYLLSQGHTHENTNGVLPLRITKSFTLEEELEARRRDLEMTKRDLNALEEEIQRIFDEPEND